MHFFKCTKIVSSWGFAPDPTGEYYIHRSQTYLAEFGWDLNVVLVPPLGNVKFSLELCTRLHGFKYEFSKIFWGGAHRALSPDSFPRSISGFAFDSGFDLKSRAVRPLGLGFTLKSPQYV